MPRWTSVLLLAWAATWMNACITMPWVPRSADGEPLPAIEGPGLVASSGSPVPDVPMPIGFVAVVSRSSSQVIGQVRFVDHLYQGRASAADTVGYYRQQIRQHNWQPISEQTQQGVTVIRLNKGRENLEISVSQEDAVTSVRVLIRGEGG